MKSISELVEDHNRYRRKCLNLQASENILIKEASNALSSDLAGRYWHRNENGENDYGGTEIFTEIIGQSEQAAKDLYGSRFADLSPIGGHLAALAVVRALIKPDQKLLHISSENGGYPGYDSHYIPSQIGAKEGTIPYIEERQEIDLEALRAQMKKEKPSLIVLGQSAFVKEYDLKQVKEICDEASSELAYDGSHVMGLIAGKAFQKDVLRYSSVLFGSTHKTFPGPQGGIILTNDQSLFDEIGKGFTWAIQDNIHLARVAALGIALEDMKKTAQGYAQRVTRNSHELGKLLYEKGFGIRFSPWFSFSHQLLVDPLWLKKTGKTRSDLSKTLERNNIIVDRDGRIGTSEISRLGYENMEELSNLMVSALHGENVGASVIKISSKLYGDFK